MNWKSEAKEKLRRYSAMQQASVNIPAELERLEIDAQSIRAQSLDSPSVVSGCSRREDALLDNFVQRQELRRKLEQAESWVKTVQGALGVLTPRDRLILLRLYIAPEKKAVERLCSELGIEKSSLYRYRDQALYKFTRALYGVEDIEECLLH